ncbi:glycosyltransferase [Pseudoflavitalea sp. G-6-1-2]|uniref:glycosyltransferase n=1 Tax=Pseudoflavitalea sp. G-6-1-2 TaxID=2728841 RepID=UPI00146D8AF6|nr:glycosyltransferase [Pseudoflavitalea sp. G-6-1-2]NML21290.1 glycosyltransferase [Pseudoflavitalea sp. G-6-1-2]
MAKQVVIIGPAHPLRGGLSTFDHRLCKQFKEEGYDCCIYSFSLLYPSFLFPGTSQYTTEPAPEGIEIYSVINSIHPLNWLQVGNELNRLKPDLIVVRFWLPLIGPALGTILRRAKKNGHTKVVAITDNVIPHEKRPGDTPFTRYFLKACDAFVTMSDKVMTDLRKFVTDKPAIQAKHPLYDTFGDPIPKSAARAHLRLKDNELIVLFFGFIRKYKGLDILLEAMQLVKKDPRPIRLLVAGEYYEDEAEYNKLISQLGIADVLIMRTQFIPDSEVKYYLCAADVVVQPYRNATQSGVTPLAYHFEAPMIVTNVGGLPDLVPHDKVGLVCEPNPASIAAAISEYFDKGEQYFLPHLRTEKQKYSWQVLVNNITDIAALPTNNKS